jgi:hypothetical protein
VPGELTEITEIATALGMLAPDLPTALSRRPPQLANVPDGAWERLLDAHDDAQFDESFATAFDNGRAFLMARDGLRGRKPLIAEWKGPHRPPGDDVIPADLRIDRVYLLSCKYLSKVLLNPGPSRLFERLLVGETRSSVNWFDVTAPAEFQSLYAAARSHAGAHQLPEAVRDLTRDDQQALRSGLSTRTWPEPLHAPWSRLCEVVAAESAARWDSAMSSTRERLRLLWRMLRISSATYFVLGTDRSAHLRLRVDSAWDWMQAFELRAFEVAARNAGQPEVAWHASVRRRSDGAPLAVDGHVEIRWSHGRFVGSPEAKVYLDTPHDRVPGYHALQ